MNPTKMFTCGEYWIIMIYSLFSCGNSLNKKHLELMNWFFTEEDEAPGLEAVIVRFVARGFGVSSPSGVHTHLSESTLEKPRDKSRALSKSFSLSTLLLIQTIKAAVLRSLFYIHCVVLQLRDLKGFCVFSEPVSLNE